jgi:cyanophycinase
MKKTKYFLVFALLCLVVPQFTVYAQQPHQEGKLIIIGGGHRPEALVQRIIKEAQLHKGGYGIILPMSSAEPDSAVFYAKKQFVAAGLSNVVGLQVYKDENLRETKLDSIKNAKMIYISGGDQNRFMRVISGTSAEAAIHEAFKNGSIVAGTSAGAAVMSKLMITGNELKHPDYSSTFKNIEAKNIDIQSGLGMVKGVIIDQHFVKRSRYNRLISAIIGHPELIGIGIDESTALLVEGNSVEVLGESQVIVFKNPTKSKFEQNGKLGAKNLELDIYLPGQKFKLN